MFESRKVKQAIAQKLIEQKANEAIANIAAKELVNKQKIAARIAASEEKKAENKRINDLRMVRLMNRKKGDKIPFKELPFGAKITVIFFAFFIIGGIGVLLEDKPTPQELAKTAQIEAEGKAAEEEKKSEEKAQEAKEDLERAAKNARTDSISYAQIALESSLRDPSSVQYIFKGYNLTNNSICIEYRAKNGFGGYSVGYLAVSKGKPIEGAKQYVKYCSGEDQYQIVFSER